MSATRFIPSIRRIGQWYGNDSGALQVNIVLFALAVETLRLCVRGHDVLAGCTLGAAPAIKVMPVLLIGYFLFQGRFLARALAGDGDAD
jgi:glycosyl transferase family 87